MRKTFRWFLVIVPWALVSVSFAERIELQPPKTLNFDPREHMKPNYRDALDALCKGGEDRPTAVTSLCRTLGETLNQEKLLESLTAASAAIPPETHWGDKVRALNEMVSGGRYVLTVPVEFRKLKPDGWEVRWRQWSDETRSWSGPYQVRRVTPMPEMHALVEATVLFAEGRFRFGYTVKNLEPGNQRIGKLDVDAEGLTEGRVAALEANRGRLYGRRESGGLGYLIQAPRANGYLRLFTIWAFDPREKDGRPAVPGQTIVFPPLLEVPWASLPGVLRCWVEGLDWDGPRGLSGESDPSDVADMVDGMVWEETSLGPKKIPRWALHGKTIGPVPTPDEGAPRGEWVDRLVAWHGEARKWGWYDKGGEELWETRAAELKADPSDQRIRDLLARVEEDHEAGRLLEETYALWRYNLEYLLRMPQ